MSGSIGGGYALDITRWVPYFQVLGGGYHFTGDSAVTAPGISLALGLDYQIKRNFAVGAQLRRHEIFAPDPWGSVTYSTNVLRAEYLWGF